MIRDRFSWSLSMFNLEFNGRRRRRRCLWWHKYRQLNMKHLCGFVQTTMRTEQRSETNYASNTHENKQCIIACVRHIHLPFKPMIIVHMQACEESFQIHGTLKYRAEVFLEERQESLLLDYECCLSIVCWPDESHICCTLATPDLVCRASRKSTLGL